MAPEVYAPLRQFAAHYHDRGTARAAVHQLHSLFGDLSEEALPQPPEPAPRAEPRAAGLSARRLTLVLPGARGRCSTAWTWSSSRASISR